jgi:biopolymer transport protein ExbD
MKIPLKKQPSKISFSVRLTPFIDVVFLLMIFFILTIRVYRPEGVLRSRLPELGDQIPLEQEDLYNEPVRIRLMQQKENFTMFMGERTLTDYQDLFQVLRKLPSDTQLIIEPQDGVFYQYIIGTYNICLKAERQNIVFSVPSLE